MPEANDELIPQPAQAATKPVKMTPEELKEARRKFEAGQTTRRAALRKIGITAGAAFFALFAVDDLARIAGKRLEQMQIDNKIADDLAKELRSVGVAFAGTGSASNGCGTWQTNHNDSTACDQCDGAKLSLCYSHNPGGHAACDECNTRAQVFCTPPNYQSWYDAWHVCGVV